MNTKTQQTYDLVFQQPMALNLDWKDVRALFETVGEVEEKHNGDLEVTIAGNSASFEAESVTNHASTDQVSQIRELLKDYGSKKESDPGPQVLLVIDYHEAKIYHTEAPGATPDRVTPSAHEQTNFNAYFTEVSKSLMDAEKILIFGSGTGHSSAMDTFVAWLKEHRKKISDCVIDTVTIDKGHLTEGQILAKAREIYDR